MRVQLVLVLSLIAGCHVEPARRAASASAPSTPREAETLHAQRDVAALVARVRPAVVDVMVVRTIVDPQRGPTDAAQRGVGSGFIIDRAGHVITNAHVVDGATAVHVRLSDERDVDAKVVGKDPWLDVAVLEIRGAASLPTVPVGESGALQVGEPVVAIGNPYGLGSTVTMGIVSAKGRAIGIGPYDDFIQTDASINPGNSGGPLFDLHGRVVGINTAVHPRGKGLGFAIPIDDVKEVLPQLLAKGKVERGLLGVRVDPASWSATSAREQRGARVASVERGSPAERSGLREEDVIVSVNGAPLGRESDLPRMIASRPPGTHLEIGIVRQGVRKTVAVTLGAFSEETRGALSQPEETEGTDLGAPASYHRP
jgi:serine protease Do